MTEQPDLSEQYRTWKNWDASGFAALLPETELYYARELGRAGAALDRPLSVLEIGFGNGGFAGFAAKRGWTYSGTEIDPELVARAVKAGLDVHLADPDLGASFAGQRFDLITAFDVLEHLTHAEIAVMLGHVAALLAPDGRFVARFPSGDSPFSFGMQNGDMTHRSHIGSGMVRQFCIGAGLVPVQIRAPVLPVRGLGLRRALRRAPVHLARRITQAVMRRVFYDNQPRVSDPNMVIVLKAASRS